MPSKLKPSLYQFSFWHNSQVTQTLHRYSFRNDVQSLRGIAIICVLLFHLPNTFFHRGFLGVDIFFVISGFLITPKIIQIFENVPNISEVKNNFKEFAINRTRRLAPAFSVTILIFLPLLLLFGDAHLGDEILNQALAGLLLFGNVGAYKFGGDYFHPGVANPFLHLWSLSVEEQIYIFLPVILFVLYLSNRVNFASRSKKLILVLSLGSLLLTFYKEPLYALYGHFLAVPANFSFYSPVTRFWEFAAGALISVLPNLRVNTSLLIPIRHGVNLLFALFILTAPQIRGEINLLIAVLFTSAMIITRSLDQVPRIFNRLLGFFGDRSYSLYLVHLPIFYLISLSPIPQRFLGDGSLFLVGIALIFTLLLGNWMYLYVEIKFHKVDRGLPSVGRQSQKSLLVLVGSSWSVPLLLIPLVGSGFLGTLKNPGIDNPGTGFKEHCVRHEALRQYPCSFPSKHVSKTIALVGDSHMAQYSLMIWALAESNGYRLIFLGDIGREADFSRTLESLSVVRPNITIVSKFWSTHSFAKDSDLIRDLENVILLSRQMVVIGQNPVFMEKDEGKRISLMDALLGDETEQISTTVARLPLPESKISDGQIRKFAVDSKIEYVDVFRVLCPRTFCQAAQNGKALYVDSNHLSTSGALMLRKDFSRIINGEK